MATAVEKQLYPFSTEDAQAIPLDIILPKELLFIQLAAEAAASVTIPTGFNLVAVYSSVDVLLDFANAAAYPLAAGTFSEGVFVPGSVMMTFMLPDVGAIKIVPVANRAGWCTIQNIQKWAGLGLRRQLGSR